MLLSAWIFGERKYDTVEESGNDETSKQLWTDWLATSTTANLTTTQTRE